MSHCGDAAKAVISNFEAMNPRPYQNHLVETQWLMTYLVDHFNLGHYLCCAPDPSDESQRTAWRDGVLADLVEEWEWSMGLSNGKRDVAQQLRFEGYLHWYMESVLAGRQRRLDTAERDSWHLFIALFVGKRPSLSQTVSKQPSGDYEGPGESSNLLEGTVSHENTALRPLFRLTRNVARATSYADLRTQALIMPTRHSIDTEAVLETLLLKVRETHLRYHTILGEHNGPVLKRLLIGGLHPRVRAICEGAQFDLRR